jgi:hypothetical protein
MTAAIEGGADQSRFAHTIGPADPQLTIPSGCISTKMAA